MLNDFGFAVEAGSMHSFAGTIRFAPTAVLESYAANPSIAIKCECWHDLESAVKLTWSLYAPSRVYEINSGDAAAFLRYWRSVEVSSGELKQLLPLARTVNYERLILELKEVCNW
jgi:hypothetical protein